MRRFTLALILVFVATSLFAQAPEMKPDPKLRQLDYLTGSWGCKGTAFANPMSPEHPTMGTVSSGWQMGDYWLAFTYAEMSSDKNPMPFSVGGFMGYDAEQKKYVMSSVDNMGGHSSATSDGWKDNTLTWDGSWHMGPMTMKARDTFTKKNADEFVHAGWVEQAGKWMKMDEETCTKSM